jgi:hypothetical protein
MIDLHEMSGQTLYQRWSSAAASLVACQWKLFDAHYRVGLSLVKAVLDPPARETVSAADVPASGSEEELRRLQELSVERVRQGLAPPPKVYRAPYRGRIDWLAFPDWVRPSDPDLFEDCGHEG